MAFYFPAAVGCVVLVVFFLALVVLWATNSIKTFPLSLGFIVTIAGVVALLSLGAVEQNEYGLVFNWVSKSISPTVHHGGVHFIGFWNSYVTFPATVQTIEFSEEPGIMQDPLHTRTKEGLALHLSISCQYKLDRETIPQLYALTNVQYEGLFRRIAREEILQGAAMYEGPQYWLNRKGIGHHMRDLVDAKLKESYSSLWGLQLLNIDLPDRYEASITKTQVQSQIIKTRGSQQVAASIRADTEVLRASYNRDISIVQAGAQANYTLQTKLAEAEASRRKIEAEAEALQYTRQTVKLSDEGVVKYTRMAAYGQLENSTFLANLPGLMPTFQVSSGGRAAAGRAERPGLRPGERAALAEQEGADSEERSGTAFLQSKGRAVGPHRGAGNDFDSIDDSPAPLLGRRG